MERFDLCANSATLTQQQKDFANQVLWDKLAQVGKLYDRHGAKGNLYLGGSVGLKQPSLLVSRDRTVGMKSDLDLFYLLPNLPPAPAEQAFLEAVAALPQDLEVSVHPMPAIQIEEQLFSTAFDDIFDSLKQPVIQGFDFSPSQTAPRFNAKTIALMAARMAGTGVAPYYVATHQYANLTGDRIERDAGTVVKVAITFLRLPCYQSLADRFSYAALLRLGQEGFYEGICSSELVHDLVRRREQVDSDEAPPQLSLLELFRGVAARDVGLPAATGTVDICRAYRAKYLKDDDALDSWHALLLPLALWVEDPCPDLLELARQELQREFFAQNGRETDFLERLAALLAQQNPPPSAMPQMVAELVHFSMRAVTEFAREKVVNAYTLAQASRGQVQAS